MIKVSQNQKRSNKSIAVDMVALFVIGIFYSFYISSSAVKLELGLEVLLLQTVLGIFAGYMLIISRYSYVIPALIMVGFFLLFNVEYFAHYMLKSLLIDTALYAFFFKQLEPKN